MPHSPLVTHPHRAAVSSAQVRRRRLAWLLALAISLGLVAGIMTGPAGLSARDFVDDLRSDAATLIIGQIRLPRTLGAALVGALLGLAGAIAQGVFRNPLADPYLLGSAAGAALAVVLVLALSAGAESAISPATASWLDRIGLVAGAFVGAVGGVALTLVLSGGAAQTLRLLLAGVIVGVLLAAVSDLVVVTQPHLLPGRQAFLLGSTALLSLDAVWLLGIALVLLIVLAARHARLLDALTLGEDSAASLGLNLSTLRLQLVLVMSLATAVAISQAGLIAFVGLVAPHLVRRHAPGPNGWLLLAASAMGAALMVIADVLARALIAPQELPVGVVTAILGGAYLFVLLRQRWVR